MANTEENLKSTSVTQRTKCSFRFSETHQKDDQPQDNKDMSHLNRNTPILFSTHRGLHLRIITNATTLTPHTPSLMTKNTPGTSTTNSNYRMLFCDLERWSTNRANTISLEDTFTVPKPAVAANSLVTKSLKFLPRKSTSVHFNDYSRFDTD